MLIVESYDKSRMNKNTGYYQLAGGGILRILRAMAMNSIRLSMRMGLAVIRIMSRRKQYHSSQTTLVTISKT